MNQVCTDCGHRYDDESRSTICPHSGILYSNNLCIVHDLHGCSVPVSDGAGGTVECSTLAQRVLERLEPIFPGNGITPSVEARQWLHKSEPRLNMQIPRELIATGQIERVLTLVHKLRDQAPAACHDCDAGGNKPHAPECPEAAVNVTIGVFYSCPECGIKDREVRVKAREGEDVIEWMEKSCMIALGTDHQEQSPNCNPDELHDVKIPVNNVDRVGGATAN